LGHLRRKWVFRRKKGVKIYKNLQKSTSFSHFLTKIYKNQQVFRNFPRFFAPMFISYAYDKSLLDARRSMLVARYFWPQRTQSSQRLMLYERVGTRIRLQLTAFLDASICQVFPASTSTPLELFVKQMTAVAGCWPQRAEENQKSNCKMQKCGGY